jgi:hypothetical protein
MMVIYSYGRTAISRVYYGYARVGFCLGIYRERGSIMADELQLPVKVILPVKTIKGSQIVGDWKEEFVITLRAKLPEACREELEAFLRHANDQKRQGGIVRPMMPWDARRADIIIE